MAFALDYPELEELFTLAGGKFRLTVLLQRRVAELVEGAPRLVRLEQKYERDFVRVAVEELKQGKIKLSADNATAEKTGA
jgi:DNA-directed RNA polymerase subunit K/omega